jgi:hypothetical protein
LRAAAALVAGLVVAGVANAQNTTLTVDGVTAGDNSGAVNVKIGATTTVKIHATSGSSRPYGLFGATANNAAATGWYLKKNAGTGKKPWPVVTGVATTAVEAAFAPLDIVPDRGSNPRIHLDANGDVTLVFRVPSTTTAGTVIYYQAVSLPVGSNTPNYSNAITVTYVAATKAASLLVSQSATDSNHVQLGTLAFNATDPRPATFTPEPSTKLGNLQPDSCTLGDTNQWSSRFAASSVLRKGRSIDFQSLKNGPAVNQDNYEYARVMLPALPGANGIFGDSDDIPTRTLMRCLDNVTTEALYVLVNRGSNPNQPGTSFYGFDKLRSKNSTSPATTDAFKQGIAVSPDGSRAAVIFADSNTAIAPIMYLIATDGSKPFLDSSNVATDVVNVTPGGTANLFPRAFIFTNNRLWFAVGSTTATTNNQSLWTVDARAQKPTPAQVTIPLNANYSTPVIDSIPDKCMIIPRGGGTKMCFLAGDTVTTGAQPAPDYVQKGDWYCATEATPTSAINVTKFPVYGSSNTPPKLLVPGDASGGSTFNGPYGFASMSPDGSKLAFVALTTAENGSVAGEDDEVYVATTNDLNNDGVGDDAGSTLFNNPITTNARINSTALGNTLDNSAFLNMVDSDNLLFFYGVSSVLNTAQMDLFNWRVSTSTLTCLTRVVTQPITTAGTIVPEGGFFSPNGRYYYFSRGISDANATGASLTKTNLVCVDTQTLKLINITGSEFSGATTLDTANTNTVCENFNWHLTLAGGNFPSLCYFAAPMLTNTPNTMQVWAFDQNFPSAALQLTSDTSAGATVQNVESLVGSPYSMGCAWYWTRNSSGAQSEAEYQDLTYFFRDVLTQGTSSVNPFGWSDTLSAIEWIPAASASNATGAAPPALVMCIGDTSGAGSFADQASDGEFYYFSLDGTMDYLFNATTGNDAPNGHEIGTTALSGAKFKGYLNVFYASVQ